MNYTITAYSTALFSTWIFIEELGLLFDAGDGLSASLLQKSRKIKNVFISHADRDHLTGLMQFNQLNAREGLPKIHYPKDCGTFPYLASFLEKFDPHVKGTVWTPIQENMEFHLKGNLYIEAIRNEHVPVGKELSKSLSYRLIEKKTKLKAEYANLDGKAIAQLAHTHGKDYITHTSSIRKIGYSGDTPVTDYERWDNTKLLIHEATFLEEQEGLNNHAHKHSNLDEVMKMVSNIRVDTLVLSHFSSRYSTADIQNAIQKAISKYGIDIPVYAIYPGCVHKDILGQEPINS